MIPGSEPNWHEVANASGFYAMEVSRLCLGAEEDVSKSRLLARFFESLSSLVRHSHLLAGHLLLALTY